MSQSVQTKSHNHLDRYITIIIDLTKKWNNTVYTHSCNNAPYSSVISNHKQERLKTQIHTQTTDQLDH